MNIKISKRSLCYLLHSVIQLETPGNLFLEQLPGIVFIADSFQERHTLSTIPLDGLLPASCVIEVEVRIVRARGLASGLGLFEEILGGSVHFGVVGRDFPLHGQQHVDEVAVGGVETEAVAAVLRGFGDDCLGQGLEAQAEDQAGHAFESG